jgi:hypothetical protein
MTLLLTREIASVSDATWAYFAFFVIDHVCATASAIVNADSSARVTSRALRILSP